MPMDDGKDGVWKASTGLARAILSDRRERRRWLGWMILVPLLMMAAGIWGFQDWLWQNAWRAFLWWGGCLFATLIVILFAAYDALAVIREERAKIHSNVGKK
jgi:hypothetical protein